MIPDTQLELLKLLAELCELSPDVRLGQLIAHLGFLGEDQTGRSLANIEDDELVTILFQHRNELTERQPDPPRSPPQSLVTTESHVDLSNPRNDKTASTGNRLMATQ